MLDAVFAVLMVAAIVHPDLGLFLALVVLVVWAFYKVFNHLFGRSE